MSRAGKHSSSKASATQGLRCTPATSVAHAMHAQNIGSMPAAAATPYPIATPAKMQGKKCPPLHPKLMHSGVTAHFASPVATSTTAPMEAQPSITSPICTSPGKSTKGRGMASAPRARPAASGFAIEWSPTYRLSAEKPRSDA